MHSIFIEKSGFFCLKRVLFCFYFTQNDRMTPVNASSK